MQVNDALGHLLDQIDEVVRATAEDLAGQQPILEPNDHVVGSRFESKPARSLTKVLARPQLPALTK